MQAIKICSGVCVGKYGLSVLIGCLGRVNVVTEVTDTVVFIILKGVVQECRCSGFG